MLIPPTAELACYGAGDSLVLAHLLEPGLPYEEHYYWQGRCGDYLILDNSAFELGASGYSMTELLDMATRIRAKEIVFPDAMQDAARTATMVSDSMKVFAQHPNAESLRPMYVPQGQTHGEYAECLRFIVRTHAQLFGTAPFTLGISRVYDEVFAGGRAGLLGNYYTALRDECIIAGADMQIHLLGWSSIPALARIAQGYPWVRSVDSSKPFAWALGNKYLHQLAEGEEEPQRPENYFSCTLTDEQHRIADYNIRVFKYAAEGNQVPQGIL